MKPTEIYLEGDGDFRSPECVKLLDEADIVVTNPPFSLFREYVAQLVEHGKKFLIIGNINATKFKDIFPLIKANKLWLGFGTDSWYGVPDDFDDRPGVKVKDGKKYFKVKSRWYTNLDVKKRHEKLILTEKYDQAKYPKYDNYDAINVDKVTDIPKNYDGVMGVPITFLDKYNPEQFEIVGELNNGSDNEWDYAKPMLDGKVKYMRILIRRKPSGENEVVDDEEIQVTELEGDGDFRSEECVKLLDEADIVVTNPPFSLFREYVAQLVEHGKKFLIIGNFNGVTFKEIFPLIKNNKLWLGCGQTSATWFEVPEDTENRFAKYVDGKKMVPVKACWYTNLDHAKRHEKLVLTEHYTLERYPKFDNYDAINVDKTCDIPKDYDGVMGVPITFLDKYNPEQFEIVQFRKGEDGKDLAFTREREREWCRTSGCSYEEFERKFPPVKMHGPGLMTSGQTKINGKSKYNRILIQRRKPSGETPEETRTKWPKQETPGLLRPVLNGKYLYRRVLIKRRNKA